MKRSQVRGRPRRPSRVSHRRSTGRAAPRPGRAVASSVGATLLLAALVFGSPVALLAWGRLGVLRRLPAALGAPDDGSMLLALLTLVGWAAWLVFTLCVMAETINLVAGIRGHLTLRVRLPWLGGVQGVAAGLLVASLALLAPVNHEVSQPAQGAVAASSSMGSGSTGRAPAVTPGTDRAAPAGTGSTVGMGDTDRAVTATVMEEAVRPGAAGEAGQDGVVARTARVAMPRAAVPRISDIVEVAAGAGDGVDHLVGPADSLWSLAEQWYGDGTAWRRIAAANPDVDPSSLPVGARIAIPAMTVPARTGPVRAVPAGADAPRPVEDPEWPTTVTVRRGDTLGGLARAHLGDAERWPEIYRLNRDRISDPDEIDIGWQLRLPPSAVGGRESAPQAGAQAPVVPRSLPLPADDHAADESEQTGDREGSVSWPGGRAAESPSGSRSPAAGETGAGAPPAPPVAGQDALAEPEGGQASTADLVRTALAGLSLFLAGAISGAMIAGRRSQLFTRPIGRRVPRLRGEDAHLASTMAHARDVAVTGRPLGDVEAGGTAEYSRPVDPDDLPPASVVLGTDGEDRPVLLDLARTDGWLAILGSPADAAAMVSSVALSLTCTRWSEGLEVVAVGPGLAWLGGTGREDVVVAEADVLAESLGGLGGPPRPTELPTPAGGGPVSVEPPPVVRVILMDAAPENGLPDPGTLRNAGVVLVSPLGADARGVTATVVHLDGPDHALLEGRTFTPQLVAEPVRRGIVTLVEATGTDRTEPAPWWDHDPARAESTRAEPPPEPASSPPFRGGHGPAPTGMPEPVPIRPAALQRRGADSNRTDTAADPPPEDRPPARALPEEADVSPGTTRGAPVLNVLGTVELTGARGPEPSKGRLQCLEYCAWILCHPGAGSAQMRSALMVAEPTRRSNTSRLRRWLGTDDDGRAFLPEAYDGVIRISDAVGTDWERAQVLLTGGVNRAADGNLRAVLELVRGAPMADAAPGQWHWAEEWRTEMVQTIRDVALELAGRARRAGDLRTARSALDRALVCCPEDEDLLCEKIRVAHLADDRQEVDRLVYVTARMARRLGVDLSEDTVVLLQEVMEGHARARVV